MQGKNPAMKLSQKHTVAVLLLLGCSIANHLQAAESTYGMTLDAPIATWDEAIPLGNGMLGGLLWGTNNTSNLSLDRGDLWDETTPPEILEGTWNFANRTKLVKENCGD